MKYGEFVKYFDTFPTFTMRDARLFLKKHGASDDYCRLFMHNIIKGGKVFRIGRGTYTLHDDPMLTGFAWSPFYYGMETALTHYGLWNYVTPISIITSKRVRKREITLLGRNAKVRQLSRKYMFGYSMVEYSGMHIPMASIEKTLIDSVYFHERFSNEVMAAIMKRIDRKVLADYLKVYPLVFRQRFLKGIGIKLTVNAVASSDE